VEFSDNICVRIYEENVNIGLGTSTQMTNGMQSYKGSGKINQ